MKTIELKVTGMHCPRCEKAVAAMLETVEGVEKAICDRRYDRVLVRLTDDNASVEAMKAAVESDPDKDFRFAGVVD